MCSQKHLWGGRTLRVRHQCTSKTHHIKAPFQAEALIRHLMPSHQKPITDIKFIDKKKNGESDEDRALIYDLHCQLEGGGKIMVALGDRDLPTAQCTTNDSKIQDY